MLHSFPRQRFPLFWHERELALLQGSYMRTYIDMQRRAISSEYECICEDYPPFRHMCSLQRYSLIWTYTRANAFTMPSSSSALHTHTHTSTSSSSSHSSSGSSSGSGKTVGIVPLLDAIASLHSSSRDASDATDASSSSSSSSSSSAETEGLVETAYNDEREVYEVLAVGPIRVGTVLTKPMDYISIHKQLLTFGVCDPQVTFFWDQLQPHHPREAFFLRIMRLLLAAVRSEGSWDESLDWDAVVRTYGPVLLELAQELQQGPASSLPSTSKDIQKLLLDVEQTCTHYLSL
jgi:hypothetical protein